MRTHGPAALAPLAMAGREAVAQRFERLSMVWNVYLSNQLTDLEARVGNAAWGRLSGTAKTKLHFSRTFFKALDFNSLQATPARRRLLVGRFPSVTVLHVGLEKVLLERTALREVEMQSGFSPQGGARHIG